MDCCTTLNKVFDQKNAIKDEKHYRKKGLRNETGILSESLISLVKKKSVLETGCGIGMLSLTLAKAGAKQVLGVDASQASIKTATKLSREEKVSNVVKFMNIDFVPNHKKIKKYDLVVSDKVVCCYHDMERFISSTVSHSKEYYAIVFPRDNLISKTVSYIGNFILRFTKYRGFRFYIHKKKRILELIGKEQFKEISHKKTFVWEIYVFKKNK